MKALIFAGADIPCYDWIKPHLGQYSHILCADSGLRHAHALNLSPDIIIGDFDSVDSDMMKQYENQSHIIHDGDQNATDLMKAIAISPAGIAIDIYGAIGERADHDFSNYLILMGLEAPDHITLLSQNDRRCIIKSSHQIDGNIGDHVGIFPLSPIENLTFQGLEYPADGLDTPHHFGWNGACNVMNDNQALISFDSGTILVTHTTKS